MVDGISFVVDPPSSSPVESATQLWPLLQWRKAMLTRTVVIMVEGDASTPSLLLSSRFH